MRNIDATDPGLAAWVRQMIQAPKKDTPYTLATLPDAAEYRWATLTVSDGASNRPTVTSDGTVWRYQDGTTV